MEMAVGGVFLMKKSADFSPYNGENRVLRRPFETASYAVALLPDVSVFRSFVPGGVEARKNRILRVKKTALRAKRPFVCRRAFCGAGTAGFTRILCDVVMWIRVFPYFCYTKTGCGSDEAGKSELFLASPLAFHYLCYTKIGCGSDEAGKSGLFLASPLAFAYLCPDKQRRAATRPRCRFLKTVQTCTVIS